MINRGQSNSQASENLFTTLMVQYLEGAVYFMIKSLYNFYSLQGGQQNF